MISFLNIEIMLQLWEIIEKEYFSGIIGRNMLFFSIKKTESSRSSMGGAQICLTVTYALE